MKTIKTLAILIFITALTGNVSGQNSPVKFKGIVTTDEVNNVIPICYGDYFVETEIYEILEDVNNVLNSITTVKVCYQDAKALVSGNNVEVYGYYWGGICPKQYCDRVQILDGSYYIKLIEEYGDNDWMVVGKNMYAIPPGNVGIGTTEPGAPLDVRRSAPGNNLVAGLFTNTSDAADSSVSINLGIGTAAPSAWRLMASHNSLNIGNAVVAPPAITIGSSNNVAISNGLSVGGGGGVAVHAASGTIPLIYITGKHGIVTFGQDYGIYAWGGQKAGCFSGDVYISGKLGIGTAEPQEKLHVAGIAQFDLGGGNISMSTPGGWPGLIAYSPNGHRRDIIIDNLSIRLLTSSSSSAAPSENGITIREEGNVGIGTYNPGSFKLAVNGTAAKPGGGSWSSFSDIRLKNLNGSYKRGLSEISRLNPVLYSYKENNELQLPADSEFAGLVAQDVQSVIPEAVQKNTDGYLTVNNDPIIWAMVNAIKQLKVENDQLKQRLDALEQNSNK